jgi:hypothetical protein
MRQELLAKLPEAMKSLKVKDLPKELLGEFKRFVDFRNWAFAYPSMLLYFAAAFSDNIATALLRRAPDENDD